MNLKKCEQCGEEVDQAKAFCPECGNPFVEEQAREESSEYDKYAGTVNVSKSMYKMMLSEMELDTSASPDKKEEPSPPKTPKESKMPPQKTKKLQPESKPDVYQKPAPSLNKPVNPAASFQEEKSETFKWVAVASIGLFVLGILAVAILLIGYFYFV